MKSLSIHIITFSPRKRNVKKAKWLSKEVLQIAEKRREAKGKGENCIKK